MLQDFLNNMLQDFSFASWSFSPDDGVTAETRQVFIFYTAGIAIKDAFVSTLFHFVPNV